MFVIAQSLKNIKQDANSAKLSTEDKIGLSLQHAGVAITVTSVTDIVAFSLSSYTVG